MKRALLWSGVLTGMGCMQANAAAPAKEKKVPNVVFIIADDLGYGDLSCYGQENKGDQQASGTIYIRRIFNCAESGGGCISWSAAVCGGYACGLRASS